MTHDIWLMIKNQLTGIFEKVENHKPCVVKLCLKKYDPSLSFLKVKKIIAHPFLKAQKIVTLSKLFEALSCDNFEYTLSNLREMRGKDKILREGEDV